jgi:D-alanyl-lipoteichoic acid acyltransferase DltB (MBOAT superfamily)
VLFQSLGFAVFLPIVLAAYWAARGRLELQNATLAIASLVFYSFGGLRFLPPLIVATLVTYAVALIVGATPEGRRRTLWMVVGVVFNLAILGYFKYSNFFVDSIDQLLIRSGSTTRLSIAAILLPVGISFYIFRSISYIVDVNRGETTADKSPWRVFLYVSFFPYMLAGPVDRSKDFFPQMLQPRTIGRGDVEDALRLILWGLFKKIVIADALAGYVDYVFLNFADLNGSSLVIGIVYFTVQLYADFSGYSDIAVGVAKLFGFNITQNFRMPFFAISIADFWRRWHISLYNWFNDYLFGPLAIELRNFGKAGVIAAVVVTFTLSGLWHGAGWGFVVWGLLHGLYFVPLIFLRRKGKGRKRGPIISSRPPEAVDAKDAGWMLLTFSCVLFANVFFRSPTVGDGLSYLRHLASPSLMAPPLIGLVKLGWVLVLPAFEWVQRNRKHALDVGEWPYTIRYPIYAAVCLAIFVSIKPTDAAAYLYFKY